MSCGVKFYDLHRNPIACPKCGTEVEVEAARPNRRRPAAQPESAPAPAVTEEAAIAGDTDETDDDNTDEIIDDIHDDDDLVEDIDTKESKHPDS